MKIYDHQRLDFFKTFFLNIKSQGLKQQIFYFNALEL